jgi:uncharacterized protein
MTVFRDFARGATKVVGLGVGDIDVHSETLALPAWPESLSGLRLAVIADLHAGGPQVDEERIDRIVARVNRESVDLVALLGDYIDASVAVSEWIEPERIARRLGQLHSRLGVYAVLGNNDWAHAGARMRAALRDVGITLLENQAVRVDLSRIRRSTGAFWIAGLGDLMTRSADLEGTLTEVPAGEAILVFSHNPDVFPSVPESVALTLSGHTHGAQIDIPVLRNRFTPSRFGAGYTGGHIVEGRRHLYVSDGIGTSRFPVRFRARPEIPVLELRAWSSDSP